MNAIKSVAIDYRTLYLNNNFLAKLKNCILYLPISNIIMFNEMVKKVISDETYEESSREKFLEEYSNFIKFTTNLNTVLEYLARNKVNESQPVVYDKSNNVMIVVVRTFKNPDLKFSKAAMNNMTIFDYDVFNTCIYKNAILVTSNQHLIGIIKAEKLPIKYAVVNKEQSAQ